MVEKYGNIYISIAVAVVDPGVTVHLRCTVTLCFHLLFKKLLKAFLFLKPA